MKKVIWLTGHFITLRKVPGPKSISRRTAVSTQHVTGTQTEAITNTSVVCEAKITQSV